jgi:hypothetical protein
MTNHHTKNTPLLYLVFLGLCLVFLSSCIVALESIAYDRYERERAQSACNCRPGDVYSSVSGLFNVVVPTAEKVAVGEFSISENSEQEGPLFVEEVSFLIEGFGELYRAGVVRVNQQFAPLVKTVIEASAADGLAQVPLSRHYQGKLPGAIELVSIDQVTTNYGQAVQAMYRVEKGSKIKKIIGSAPPKTSTRDDALVAVMVARIGDYLIFATAQNDYLSNEDDERALIASINSKAITLMNLMTWSRGLPGDVELPNTVMSPLKLPHLERCMHSYYINESLALVNRCKQPIALQILMNSDQDNVVEDVIQRGKTLRLPDDGRGFTWAVCPSGYEVDRPFDRENLGSIFASQYNCSQR